jgi:anti-sigma factor RsiW
MADDERHDDSAEEPSLQLPSLRSAFRRGPRAGRTSALPSDTSILPATRTDEPSGAPPAPTPTQPGRPRRARVRLPGWAVALLTGAMAGLALVGLTAAGLRACSSMRGTSSCGGPGILLLLAITVVVIVLGLLLLRLGGVASPGSTSVLGTGLLVVLLLLALVPVLDAWWMVIVVPALAMATYVASWWLTTTYTPPGRPVD